MHLQVQQDMEGYLEQEEERSMRGGLGVGGERAPHPYKQLRVLLNPCAIKTGARSNWWVDKIVSGQLMVELASDQLETGKWSNRQVSIRQMVKHVIRQTGK